MNNFGRAMEATATAEESAGSAERQNAVYMESLEAKTNALKQAFQQLVLGDGGLIKFAKMIVDTGTAILNFINSPLGNLVIKLGEIVAILALVNAAINSTFVTGLISAVGTIGTTITAMGGLGATITYLTTALQTMFVATLAEEGALAALNVTLRALGINPVVLAITALIGVVVHVVKKFKEWKNGIKDTSNELNSMNNDIKSATSNIESLKQKLDELQNKKVELTDPEDIRNLQLEEKSLERQIALEEKLFELKKKETADKANELVNKQGEGKVFQKDVKTSYNRQIDGWSSVNVFGSAKDIFKQQVEGLKELNAEITLTNAWMNSYKSTMEKFNVTAQEQAMTEEQLRASRLANNEQVIQAILNYQTELEKLGVLRENFDEASGYAAELANQLNEASEAGAEDAVEIDNLVDAYINLNNASDKASDGIENVGEATEEMQDAIEDLANKYGVATDEVWKLIEANDKWQESGDFTGALADAEEQLQQTAQNAETLSDQYKTLLSDMDGLADAYSTLSKAVDEYNTSGQFTFETASSLLKLSPEYLALLQEENGQLSINKEAYDALVDAKIAEAKATLLLGAQEEIETIIQQDFQKQAQGTGETVKTEGENVKTGANTMHEASLIALEAGNNFATAWDKIVNPPNSTDTTYLGLSSEAKADIADVQRRMKESFDLLGKTGTALKNVGSAATTAGNKASGAANKSKRAAKSAENAAKKSADLIREYVIYKMEQWIDKLEAKVDKLEKKLDKLQTKLEKVQEKYEALIERNQGWLDTLVDNFEIVERFVSTGNMELDALLKKLAKLNKEYEDQQKAINDAIDARKELIDGIDEEIDKIEEQEKAIKETYSAQLEALEQTNDELERQIKLQELLDALNKAKSKMVKTYVEGQGFVYTQDSSAVSQAEKNLQEYQRSERQRKEKEAIETQRDAELEVLEKQKNELEKQKQELENANKNDEKLLSQLEKQYEEEKKQLDQQAQSLYEKIYDQTDALKEKLDEKTEKINNKIKRVQDKIDIENAKLERANKELTDYKNQTKNDFSNLTAQQKKQGDTIINKLQEISDKMGEKEKQKQEDRDNSEITKDQLTDIGISGANADVFLNLTLPAIEAKMKEEESKTKNPANTASKWNSQAEVKKKTTSKSTKSSSSSKKKKKAYGDRYIDENGIYLLGDNPNQNELVIGSRLNGAVGVNLNQGSGVVPHTLTSALMDMAEEYQRGNSNGVLNGTTNNNKSTSISIGNISLPNVQDGDAFVDYLQNFSLDMTQAAYSRT